MQKQAPTLGRLMTMVLFALSCFGLLTFLWLAFGGPIPLKPTGYQIRPFVREARPLVRNLRPASGNLATATPYLTRSFVVLNHFLNLLGYNEKGRQGPTVPDRDEGYLFWAAWLQHNGAALFDTSDANGPFRPVTLGGTCTVLKELTGDNPPLNLLYQPALLSKRVCGN